MENAVPPFGKIEPTFSDADEQEVEPVAITPLEEVAEAQLEIAPPKSRINKKRLAMLLVFVAIIAAAIVMLGSNLLKDKISEVESIAEIHTPTQSKFIDDNEEQNKFLKENPAAKDANVSVFDFDINKCLQQYSDAQCTDMYEKNLLITESK